MRCNDVRHYLSPYLDSELEGTTTYEIARHLEVCPDCRDVFAAEARLERAIVASMRSAESGDALLWQRVVASVPGRRRHRSAWIAIAAAVLLSIGIALFVEWPSGEDLIACLRRDFELMDSGRSRLDVVDSDPALLERFLSERFGDSIRVVPIDGFQLHGARACTLHGVPTAFLAYQREGKLLSLVILDADQLGCFPGTDPERTQWRDELGSVHVLAIRSGRKIVGAAGHAPPSDLERLCNAYCE